MTSIPLDSGKLNVGSFHCETECTWCDGCGDYGIMAAAKRAMVDLGIAPHEVALAFDIGCHGNMSDKMLGYRIHGLHGRVLPMAAGIKLANPNLPVIAFGGDGASFSEGVNHLVHSIRSHYPITFILHNNANYGLTTGQASSLTWQDQPMNTSPNGIPEDTIRPMELVFSLGPTFVARTWSGDIPQMTKVFKAAIQHRGFAFVDVLQACPTYNKFTTHEWLMEHCYDVADDGHDPTDLEAAKKTAFDTSERVSCGILYQNENVPHFYERLVPRQGVKTTAVEEVAITDVSGLMKEFV